MATTNLGLKTFVHDEPIDFNDWNDNLVKIDTAVGEAKRGKAAHNLLDNSWFVNPVNQRGIASGAVITGWGYFIDRWKARAENCSVHFSGDGITVSTPIGQVLPKETVKNGMTVTAAAKWSDGTICVASGTIRRTSEWGSFSSSAINGHYLYVSDEGDGQTATITISEGTIVWAALYEGTYTAGTLPDYVPKGYAAELTECQRYYREVYRVFGEATGNVEREVIVINPPMRITPTVTVKNLWKGSDDTAAEVNAAFPYGVDTHYTSWGSVTFAYSADI